MHPRRAMVFSMVVGCFPLALLGCGGGSSTDPAVTQDLTKIGRGYHLFYDNFHRGPKDAEELRPYVEAESKTAIPGLKDGRYVFIWNVGLLDMDGAGDTILAYEKDVPTKGGPVLYGDTTVKNLTAEEFKAAKKATPKKK
jgi:hypothetical protein